MARPPKPVDRTVHARAELADFLRHRKEASGMTFDDMAKAAREAQRKDGCMPSAATLKRAACGESVPAWKTVEIFLHVTITKKERFVGGAVPEAALRRGRELWIRARRATRAPYYVYKAPDPDLISSRADLSRALRDLHAWVGAPSPCEMAASAGRYGELPQSTARRIINGQTLPVNGRQVAAFLKACYMTNVLAMAAWFAACVRTRFADQSAINEWFSAFGVKPPQEEEGVGNGSLSSVA
jgi:hypothetical protein